MLNSEITFVPFIEQLIPFTKDYTIGELLSLLYLIVKSGLNNDVQNEWDQSDATYLIN